MPSSTRSALIFVHLSDQSCTKQTFRLHCQSATSRVFDDKDVFQNVSKGICVYLAAQTMSVPILTVTLSAKLELHWSTRL